MWLTRSPAGYGRAGLGSKGKLRMKKQLAAFACVTALSFPASAEAAAFIDFDGTSEISDNNNFKTWLNGLGLTHYATLGSSISLDADTTIRFDFLGSESGLDDTFFTVSVPVISFSETSALQDSFLAPLLLGTAAFNAGSLADLLNFSSSGGTATIGEDGFGIFLGANQVSGASVDTFYFGYDDQVTGQDDDHDDLIIRATILAPTPHGAVPEPATWAMLLTGFGLAGMALRRRERHSARALIRA